MKLTFCGAARAVTGSCIHIQWQNKQILVDCGLQQGHDIVDNNHFPFEAKQIHFVLLTHCHIDHCGRLPLLVKQGFHGTIYMTEPTAQLLEIMLRDSADIQENELRWRNQKKRRAGEPLEEPLYTLQDVENTLHLIKTCQYEESQQLAAGLHFYFRDAGHILGSAMIMLQYEEKQQQHTLLFSGDIGNRNMPLIEDPKHADAAEFVVMESTHGDHCYLPCVDYQKPLAQILEQTFQKGGTVLIPSAAVGRTQELLYYLHQIKQKQFVPSSPDFPVYVDSALAKEAGEIYTSGILNDYLDDEAIALKKSTGTLLDFPNLHLYTTSQQSKELNDNKSPKVIIASSAMCDSGRIRHHLKHNLWRPECTVVLLGNPRRGTLGHMLLDGLQHVKLFGDEIVIKAQIITLPVRPIHADESALLQWLQRIQPKPKQIFLNHGDEEVSLLLADVLQQQGYHAEVPHYGKCYELS